MAAFGAACAHVRGRVVGCLLRRSCRRCPSPCFYVYGSALLRQARGRRPEMDAGSQARRPH
eukprot:3648556-Rhodomonas_salina.1